MTGAALDAGATLRLCATEGCETRLSRFNSRPVCASCEARIEIGGATIPLPRQPRFASRPPAPIRPTTEGGVALPGVVKGRSRSYAEMIAKPAGAATPPAPEPARAEREHPPETPTRQPSARALANRKIDYAEAARLFRECGNYAEVGRRLGVQANTAMAAIKHELGEEEAARLLRPASRKPAARARSFDYDAAIRAFRECGNATRVARQLGISQPTVDRAIRAAIGTEEMRRIRAEHRPQKTRKPRKEHEVKRIPGLLVGPARGRRGRARAFDWAEAVRLRQTGMPVSEIATQLGGSVSAVKRAIAAAIKAGEMPAPQPPTRPRRSTDPLPAPASVSAPSIENEKPEAPPAPADLNYRVLERAGHEVRIEQIKLLLDANTAERTRLNDQARELLEEWGDINWRLSKLTDQAAA